MSHPTFIVICLVVRKVGGRQIMYIKNRTDEGIHRAAFGLISPDAVVFAARTVLDDWGEPPPFWFRETVC
jgi:hypothetical protein